MQALPPDWRPGLGLQCPPSQTGCGLTLRGIPFSQSSTPFIRVPRWGTGLAFWPSAEVPGRLSSPSPALPVAGHPLSPLHRLLLTPVTSPNCTFSRHCPFASSNCSTTGCELTSVEFNCPPSPPTPDVCTDYTLSWCPGPPRLGVERGGAGGWRREACPGEITPSQLSGSGRGVISCKEPSSCFLQIWVHSPPPRIPDLGFSLTGALSAERKPILIHIPHFNRA